MGENNMKKYDVWNALKQGIAIDDHAKGRIWHGLFMVVLHRPFRAPKACVSFAGVCLYLCFVVEVAVVAVRFYYVLLRQWQATHSNNVKKS